MLLICKVWIFYFGGIYFWESTGFIIYNNETIQSQSWKVFRAKCNYSLEEIKVNVFGTKSYTDFKILFIWLTYMEYLLRKILIRSSCFSNNSGLFFRHVQGALNEFEPNFILYNAGTDILEGDPLGCLSISPKVSKCYCWCSVLSLYL